MNCCESEVRIQNEHALRFPVISKPAPLLEYIKQISSLIGASHVLAIFEENDSIKVFFDDRRLIDSLVKTGIHVMGHHLRPDYVVAPGTKVVLSNIDPVISNFDVMRLLAMYGTIVSPVIRPSVSDDVELCHIGYGERHIYMVLNTPLPSKLEFKYGDQLCHIKIRIENDSLSFPSIKLDADEHVTDMDLICQDSVPELPSSDPLVILDNSDIPVLVSVQSAALETNSDVQNDCSESEKDKENKTREWPQKQKNEPNPVRRRGRYARVLHLRRQKITATAKAANKLTRKSKWGTRKLNHLRKRNPGRRKVQAVVFTELSSSSSDADSHAMPLLTDENGHESSENVIDTQTLESFLEEVKHNRTPLDCARKYLGENCTSGSLNNLINQLESYSKNHNSTSLKIRINRLIKSLRDAM